MSAVKCVGASLRPTWMWEVQLAVRNGCCLAIHLSEQRRSLSPSYAPTCRSGFIRDALLGARP